MTEALGPAAPTPPIPLAEVGPDGATSRIGARRVELDDAFLDRLGSACASVATEGTALDESSRDWWPLAMTWALEGAVGGRAAAVARPASVEEVAAVARLCDEAVVPLTASAGRSGVCGSAVPVHGGVVLDLCDLSGIRDIDHESLVLDVLPGTFGDHLEAELRDEHGLTLGHWPQSIALSTVGGWLACRSAGQLSNRYGKIEDMAVGLDVVLADGTLLHTGGAPRAAVGPDLNQLFIGSEGTLGIIVGARLRLHPAPVAEERAAYGFASFAAANDACRRILQRGAAPAVLRVYDAVEADRNYGTGDAHVLLVLDEGEPGLVAARMAATAEECAGGDVLDAGLVEQWMGHRNDVSALEKLIGLDLVVDTMEIAAPWAAVDAVYHAAVDAIAAVDGTLAASAHQSHAYPDGACLYFTFAGRPEPTPEAKDAYYAAVWDAGTRAVLEHGGALSHHHGVGVNRSRFVAEALGAGHGVLQSVKDALDPNGILNPGKLGLAGPFGEVPWP